jgi:hypothetical protein
LLRPAGKKIVLENAEEVVSVILALFTVTQEFSENLAAPGSR